MGNVCVKVFVNETEAFSYGACGLPTSTPKAAEADTLPFASESGGPADEVAGIDLKGLDPATIMLIMKLVELGLELLAKWLANRKKRKAA